MTTILINEVMRKRQAQKSYSAPTCMIIQVSETSYLMDTSMPGQHKKANHGTGPSSAKEAQAWLDSDEETSDNSAWED